MILREHPVPTRPKRARGMDEGRSLLHAHASPRPPHERRGVGLELGLRSAPAGDGSYSSPRGLTIAAALGLEPEPPLCSLMPPTVPSLPSNAGYRARGAAPTRGGHCGVEQAHATSVAFAACASPAHWGSDWPVPGRVPSPLASIHASPHALHAWPHAPGPDNAGAAAELTHGLGGGRGGTAVPAVLDPHALSAFWSATSSAALRFAPPSAEPCAPAATAAGAQATVRPRPAALRSGPSAGGPKRPRLAVAQADAPAHAPLRPLQPCALQPWLCATPTGAEPAGSVQAAAAAGLLAATAVLRARGSMPTLPTAPIAPGDDAMRAAYSQACPPPPGLPAGVFAVGVGATPGAAASRRPPAHRRAASSEPKHAASSAQRSRPPAATSSTVPRAPPPASAVRTPPYVVGPPHTPHTNLPPAPAVARMRSFSPGRALPGLAPPHELPAGSLGVMPWVVPGMAEACPPMTSTALLARFMQLAHARGAPLEPTGAVRMGSSAALMRTPFNAAAPALGFASPPLGPQASDEVEVSDGSYC